ncbi:hypothetical protein GCM10010431_85020 [Streptomyces kunmingensis]
MAVEFEERLHDSCELGQMVVVTADGADVAEQTVQTIRNKRGRPKRMSGP